MASSGLAKTETPIDNNGSLERARVLRSMRLGDVLFESLTRTAAISVLLLLGGIIISLFIGAWPAIKT